MATDRALSDTDIPDTISRRLKDLEIRSVRQLYARLQGESSDLQGYLRLSDRDFDELYQKVEDLVREEDPEGVLPRIHPRVNKSGVAVHRLHDPNRPRYPRGGR